MKETVADVYSYRKDLISCICISLFACETAFGTHESVPQFLPSPRHALDALIREKDLALDQTKRPTFTRTNTPVTIIFAPGPTTATQITPPDRNLAVMFSLAENALLAEFVACLESILDIARKLHGTSTWASLEEDDFEMGEDGPQAVTKMLANANQWEATIWAGTPSVRSPVETPTPSVHG